MTDTALPIDEDWTFAFDEWSEPLTLRTVVTTIDAATQQATETQTDTSLRAIVSPVESDPDQVAGLRLAIETLHLIVRADDLPTPAPDRTSLVIYRNREYRVSEVLRSVCDTVWQLTARR